jgi:hypothetical protein
VRYQSGPLTARSVAFLLVCAAVLTLDAAPQTAGTIEEASHLYFAGRYEESATLALALRKEPANELASYELRTSALHFRLKRAVAGAKDKKAALAACGPCGPLLAELTTEIAAGRAAAKARLKADERDDEARFFLGKIDLTHVWLNLETLGRRTGWGEYWEARRSLDEVLERQPTHLRARVARAWIDYIVDTRVPWGVRWMLGGGDKKGALAAAAKAAGSNGETYAVVEARFAHWEMLTREGRRPEAVAVAKVLYATFPENAELAKFIKEGP